LAEEEGDEGEWGEREEPEPSEGRDPLAARTRGWEALEPRPRLALTPREYQEEALSAWVEARGRGTVVLPTGAGKTVLALMAIARAGVRPLIVVPTIELLKQWSGALRQQLRLP